MENKLPNTLLGMPIKVIDEVFAPITPLIVGNFNVYKSTYSFEVRGLSVCGEIGSVYVFCVDYPYVMVKGKTMDEALDDLCVLIESLVPPDYEVTLK